MKATVGDDLTIANLDSHAQWRLPLIREDRADSAARVQAALARWHDIGEDTSTSILCVAHGFVVEQMGLFVKPAQRIPTSDYCGFVVAEQGTKRLILADGVPVAVPECALS